jgi:hypothetical protein
MRSAKSRQRSSSAKAIYEATIVLAQPTIALPIPNLLNKRSPSHLRTGSDRGIQFIKSDQTKSRKKRH